LRRNKKQPDYDPNELADLIATPAVGSGVGSHLLIPNQDQKVATVATLDLASVADCLPAPVGTSEAAPIVPARKSFPTPPAEEAIPPADTGVTSDTVPVVSFQVTTIGENQRPSVDTCLEATSEATTVVTSPVAVLGRLWISDSGEILPESRVHRIIAAADALSSGEEMLYRFLWHSPALCQTADSRSVQAGYNSLTKGTGFSRKTIQRTIDRLIAKFYIEIETAADIYRRTPTIYRVYGPGAVLNRLARQDCTHIAKIGPGVAFVTPLATFAGSDTVVNSAVSTVDRS
jgi:hypothetical protein